MVRARARGILAACGYGVLAICYADPRGWLGGYLKLLQSETPTLAQLAVVFDSWASDSRTELVDWPGCQSGSLCDTGITSAELATWLVEVAAHTALP